MSMRPKMANDRALDRREIVIRMFPPVEIDGRRTTPPELHVYRIGLATGKAIAACKQGEWLQHRGFPYWEYPPYGWVVENAPLCPHCLDRLVAEGLRKQ